MEIIKETKNDIIILHLKGRLDTNTAVDLEKTLIPLIENDEKKILLDFNDLEYISSTGLRILLLAVKLMKKNEGKFILFQMKDLIMEIFEIAGFTKIFTITTTLEEALEKSQ